MSTRHCVFRKSNYQIFRWLAPLAAAGFILQPWATIADTNRVGLLTIIYTNQCSGMGNDAYNDMPGWSSDGIEISFRRHVPIRGIARRDQSYDWQRH